MTCACIPRVSGERVDHPLLVEVWGALAFSLSGHGRGCSSKGFLDYAPNRTEHTKNEVRA